MRANKCLVCEKTKGKRKCPALQAWVCSQCCGLKMERGLDCAPDCYFLLRFEREWEELKKEEAVTNFLDELDSVEHDEYFRKVEEQIVSLLTALCSRHSYLSNSDALEALDHLIEFGKAELGVTGESLPPLSANAEVIVNEISSALWAVCSDTREDLLVKIRCMDDIALSLLDQQDPSDSCHFLRSSA